MLLAIDTAGRQPSLALFDGGRVRAEHTWETANFHTVELAPRVAQLVNGLADGMEALTAVAVCIGPGAYTGLRIGLAFAKALALARGLPLVGVDAFQPALAAVSLYDALQIGPLVVLVPAGRGRLIAAWYQPLLGHPPEQAQLLKPPAVTDWASLADDIRNPVVITGEWLSPPADLVRRLNAHVHWTRPAGRVRRAGYLAEIAWGRLHDGTRLPKPAEVQAVYLTSTPGAA
jgi:tRNA threonylcarbamoyladenosine biosynthesis protein TsaB